MTELVSAKSITFIRFYFRPSKPYKRKKAIRCKYKTFLPKTPVRCENMFIYIIYANHAYIVRLPHLHGSARTLAQLASHTCTAHEPHLYRSTPSVSLHSTFSVSCFTAFILSPGFFKADTQEDAVKGDVSQPFHIFSARFNASCCI